MARRAYPLVKKPVLRIHGGIDQGLRRGKGFSLAELREAGLSPVEARRLGIPVDKRRRSKHNHNVEILRKILSEG
jgi:large subunit ribosomal protein L13e